MKKIWKYTIVSTVAILLGIQLFPVERSNSPVVSDLIAPDVVKEVLRSSCYDCHSNETSWPWYGFVAPISWLVSYDVEEGREELNFSEWNRFQNDSEILEEIVEEIEEGEMPLPIYLITHPASEVSVNQLAVIREWANNTMNVRREYYNND